MHIAFAQHRWHRKLARHSVSHKPPANPCMVVRCTVGTVTGGWLLVLTPRCCVNDTVVPTGRHLRRRPHSAAPAPEAGNSTIPLQAHIHASEHSFHSPCAGHSAAHASERKRAEHVVTLGALHEERGTRVAGRFPACRLPTGCPHEGSGCRRACGVAGCGIWSVRLVWGCVTWGSGVLDRWTGDTSLVTP